MRKKVVLAVVLGALIGLGLPAFAPPCAEVRGVEAPDPNSEGQGLEGIERKVKELIEELEKLRKDASQRLRKEIIPFLEKEIDRLQQWLREFRSNGEGEPKTRRT